jgi:predicted RNase H-like HicB family nuclease
MRFTFAPSQGLIVIPTRIFGPQGDTISRLSLDTVQVRKIMRMDKYEILIYWSDEDVAFIAEVPELPGCMAHGKSQVEVLSNIRTAIRLWIKTAKEFGDTVPEPKGRRLVFA